MTRVKISAAIIAILAAMSIFSGVWVNERCRSMMESASHTAELYSQGKYEDAAAQANDLCRDWESFRKGAAVLLHNDKLTEIDRLCARITELAESANDELPAELKEINRLLELLRNGEKPQINSIF